MDSQVAKKNQSLTTAEEMRNQTKLVMQPYANWEEYLTPAPFSIAILGELVFISSKTDFSINKNPPKDGYKYIRYPDSFRACLMQVCNSGWGAFNEAHKNMDQIRLHTMAVPDYIKTAVKILFQGSDEVVETLLNHQLKSIRVIADDCLELANATEKRFTDVINIIHELLEACKNAQCFHGEELENIKKTLDEAKLRKYATEKAVKASEKEVKTKEEDVKEAQETLENKLNSLPSASELMNVFKSLIFLFSRSSINFCLEQHRAHLNMTRETYEKSVEKMENNQKELTDILITMRTCNIEEIDFKNTIDMLVEGMDAMGRVKEQWEKMVRFFQMVSNIVKTRLANDFKGFVTTSDTTQLLPHNEKLFCKDLLYNQAIQATNIVSLVNLLSTTYTEVSTKHLMDHVTSLGKLMTMDKKKPEFMDELEEFRKSCDEARKAILELVLQNKEEFEKDSVANLEKLDQELLAILPDDDAKEERSINATESGFKE